MLADPLVRIELFACNIPMKPFAISLGTMYEANNVVVKLFAKSGIVGTGEASPFPVITGETQTTNLAIGRDLAPVLLGLDLCDIAGFVRTMDSCIPFNNTIKSAFDMALYDINSKRENLPLYRFLGSEKKSLQSDLTIDLGSNSEIKAKAREFARHKIPFIKIKLGKNKNAKEEIDLVKSVRNELAPETKIRLDVNQGWTVDTAIEILNSLVDQGIQFCEQPVAYYDYEGMKEINLSSPIPVMADESCYMLHHARRLINENACSFINIKLAKTGGIYHALEIISLCEQANMHCMIGGMVESRFALTANAHLACVSDVIMFYDLDSNVNHHIDPVIGGVNRIPPNTIVLPDTAGIGAAMDEAFLEKCPKWTFA